MKNLKLVSVFVLAVAANFFIFSFISYLGHEKKEVKSLSYSGKIEVVKRDSRLIKKIEKQKVSEEEKKPLLKKPNLARNNVKQPQMKIRTPELKFNINSRLGNGFALGSMNEFSNMFKNTVFSLGDLDRRPKILRSVNPVYPYNAKRRKIRGKVVLQFVISDRGTVKDIEIIEANPAGVFENCSKNALTKWKFKPGFIGGKAVATKMILPIDFSI